MIAVFVRRVTGAAMLNAATYEEVEADRGATLQAIGVIVLASLAAGIGARGASGARPALEFFLFGTIISLVVWAVFAALVFQVGTGLLPHPDTKGDVGELLRTLGFAAAPGLLQVFAVFSGLRIPVFVIAIVWTMAGSVVAIRQALDYSTTRRAVAVCGLAWLLAFGLAAVFTAVVASAAASSGAATAERVVSITVVAKDFTFTPSRIVVDEGDLVKITLVAGDMPHSLTIDEYRIAKRARPGADTIIEFCAQTRGTFTFYCDLTDNPRCRGMKGELVVR